LSERERESTAGGVAGEGQADSPLTREPDVGLDPGILGSWPEPKSRSAA